VSLSVSDTGRGMEPDVLAHVFDPFFTTKHTGMRAGLGLSSARGIVHENEGEIRRRARLAQAPRSPCSCRCTSRQDHPLRRSGERPARDRDAAARG